MSSGGYVPAAPVLSGTFVTPETALGVAALFCAVNVISRDIAVMPRAVYRRLPGGGREIDRSLPVHDLISVQPNDDMNSQRWMQSEMCHVLTRGNGLNEIVRNKRNGEPVEIHVLHPAKTYPKRTESGQLYYELENKKKLLPEDCLHFAGMGFDGIMGYCPVTVCRQTVGLTMGAEQYGAAFFGNSARTGGWIKVARRMSEGALNSLRRSFNQIHQGSQSAHQVGILEEGMDWVNAQFSPEDAQFLATRAFQVLDIARMYGIPPHKLCDYSQAHLANVEQSNLEYVAMTLLGWVVMLESEMNCKLLTREQRQTHEIGLDMSVLLRADTAARMARVQTLRNTGAISADEIRISEGMNPIGPDRGGDKYLVQAQYIPLDQVGKIPPKPTKTSDDRAAFPGLEERINGSYINGAAA
jgi:HK97 family phage portal protein